MRHALVAKLQAAACRATCPTSPRQMGMFSYSGLAKEQMQRLRSEFGVYGVDSGRICVAALNSRNIDGVAAALAKRDVSHSRAGDRCPMPARRACFAVLGRPELLQHKARQPKVCCSATKTVLSTARAKGWAAHDAAWPRPQTGERRCCTSCMKPNAPDVAVFGVRQRVGQALRPPAVALCAHATGRTRVGWLRPDAPPGQGIRKAARSTSLVPRWTGSKWPCRSRSR
jgi:hypothetical protein